MIARYKKHILNFTFAAGTSKGVLHQKETWYLILEENGKTGIGECSVIPNISPDYTPDYEPVITQLVSQINQQNKISQEFLENYPSAAFGYETALLDLQTGGNRLFFKNAFTLGETGMPINGLIWMGNREFMETQISKKLDEGFRCLKLKVGSLNFETELEILTAIRKKFPPSRLEIRLDANGAFGLTDALEKLKNLSNFVIHSIEQPIAKGNTQKMAELCSITPIPIALDEELSGITGLKNKSELLTNINPQYIILKPSMVGGFKATEEWISIAENLQIHWWVTSALESNIGLNVIAQWTSTLGNPLPQGLGTGKLYSNNFESPLEIKKDALFYNPSKMWNIEQLLT